MLWLLRQALTGGNQAFLAHEKPFYLCNYCFQVLSAFPPNTVAFPNKLCDFVIFGSLEYLSLSQNKMIANLFLVLVLLDGLFSIFFSFFFIIQKQGQTIPDVNIRMSHQEAKTPIGLDGLKQWKISRVGHRHLHLHNCKLFCWSVALFYVPFRIIAIWWPWFIAVLFRVVVLKVDLRSPVRPEILSGVLRSKLLS